MQRFHRWLPTADALSAGLWFRMRRAQAQIAANVAVNASSSTATIPPAAFGVNVGCGDGEMVGPNVTAPLKSAGISALRYPGGGRPTASRKPLTLRHGRRKRTLLRGRLWR